MTVGPIVILGAVFVGIAVLWVVRVSCTARPSAANRPVRLLMTIAGWTLIHIGILSVVAQAFFVAPEAARGTSSTLLQIAVGCLVTMPIVMAVFAMAAARYRSLESSSLMWLLSAAGEYGIPLSRTVRSYAEERSDEIGLRAGLLADLLDSGVVLPEALDRSRLRLPLDGLVAARFGTETGDLRGAIRGLRGGTELVDELARAAIEKACYLCLVLGVAAAQMRFMGQRVLPIFDTMFRQYQIKLPSLTAGVIRLGGEWGDVATLVADVVVFVLFGVGVIGLLYYLGWLPRNFPFLGRITRRYDSALIMRTLAVGIRQHRPINRVVWILSRLYPRRSVRRRLQRAGTRMNDGEDWCDSLKRHKLIGRGDAAVLRTAQRVGNLEWALEEMADGAIRRVCYRLLLWTNVAFPLLILLIGLVIAVAVTSYFLPLIALVEALA